jgi:tRNA pseudouridine55 synthase
MIVNVYKPSGITSYDVVRKVKKIINNEKVGHSGTLDPFAEGVLLILIGNSTKMMNEILHFPKSYEAILLLGKSTSTGDYTGEITRTMAVPEISQRILDRVAVQFIGEITQIPPLFSAKRINGIRSYKLARKGVEVSHKPKKVKTEEIRLSYIGKNMVKINVTCSSGTYIRTLGEDIAKDLGTVGHLTSLKRTRIGNYTIDDAVPFDNLSEVLKEKIFHQVDTV